ncbi:uncharacterized protein DUF4440 [Luteimonas cucumeris]|uniref:Uncharacterized protein DUF4440 n=2 Tax=Luteimonas cucumeris TaxID=985012 RepID=A0A562L8E8_9GAMM|nr:uncharacterized protein DUF4440 [Luteimonas cucumeris]
MTLMSRSPSTAPKPFVQAHLRMLISTLVIAFLVAGCARAPPEQALRQSLAELQEGIEARDADMFERYLAEDFVGPDGVDRDGVRRLAALQWMRHRAVGLNFGPLDVKISDRHATVRFTAAATGGSTRMLPDTAQVYEVETGWRLHDDAWLMTSAAWKPKL